MEGTHTAAVRGDHHNNSLSDGEQNKSYSADVRLSADEDQEEGDAQTLLLRGSISGTPSRHSFHLSLNLDTEPTIILHYEPNLANMLITISGQVSTILD